MSEFTIYHNPRCSKSRQTLDLLKEKGIEPEVVEYLKTPPSLADLKSIANLLRKEPLEWIRTGEKTFKELGLSKKDERSPDEWLKILADNPILIERPIVRTPDHAVLGRPPENVLELL
jgi:arsenate reductase